MGDGRWQRAEADGRGRGRWQRQMGDGKWQMANGRWQMADGKWQMAKSKGIAARDRIMKYCQSQWARLSRFHTCRSYGAWPSFRRSVTIDMALLTELSRLRLLLV